MIFAEYTQKLEVIKHLASHQTTGNPRLLAKKLNVSERTVQRIIQHLRSNGSPVVLNQFKGTYEVYNTEAFTTDNTISPPFFDGELL